MEHEFRSCIHFYFDELMCDMCDDIYIYTHTHMVDVYGTLGLENITLEVRKTK